MERGDIVGVEVPASSANLGPGYDAFAVAVDLRLVVWATARGDRRVVTRGEGSDELPEDDSNLIWQALTSYCRWAGTAVPEVSLRVDSPIPLARGLGSSAAAAVAGVALARALTNGGGRDQDLVDLAAALEGHADNAAAATVGGLCVVVDGRVRRLEPTEALRPVVCVPPTRQSTAEARGLVPETVALAAAAVNGARAAVVLAGLSGAMAWEPEAMVDVLHEPARLSVMAATGALVSSLRAEGIAACLSGAGPSVLAVLRSRDRDLLDRISALVAGEWTVLPLRWNLAGATVRSVSDALPLRS